MSSLRKIRVLVAKPGLDGHDRGAKVIAAALRDAGMEVIYGGLHMTPEEIANISLQEDVDLIGLSILSGSHKVICRKLMAILRSHQMEDVKVVVGGVIRPSDINFLKQLGVAEVFLPGTPLSQIINYVRSVCPPQCVETKPPLELIEEAFSRGENSECC